MKTVKNISKQTELGLYDSDDGISLISCLTIDISDFCPNSNECWVKYAYAKRGLIAQICDNYEKGTDMGTTVHYFIGEHNVASLAADVVFQGRAKMMGVESLELSKLIYENTPQRVLVRTTLTEQHFQLLRDSGSIVQTVGKGDRKFYFLPFWFEHIKDFDFYMHSLGNLPTDLKDAIRDVRGTREREIDIELDEILDSLERGAMSDIQAKPKIKALFA